MHYYQFNIADFALHTSHLSLEEEGVYRRLLDYYYDTEKPIPLETQPVIRRLRLGNHQDTVGLILSEFFVKQDDGWHNLRADIEINEYKKKAETARNNGKKGGRPKKNSGLETQSVNLANQEITGSKANQELLTINHKPITNNSLSAKADGENKKPSTEISEIEKRIIEIYHDKLPNCSRVLLSAYPSSSKQSNLRARIKSNPEHRKIEFWEWFFANCSKLDYVQNGLGDWKANFDYFVGKKKFTTLVERFAS